MSRGFRSRTNMREGQTGNPARSISRSVRLLEISAVAVPADPNALAEARGAGLNLGAVSAWAQNAATKGKPAQRQYARSLVSALTAPVRKTSMANEARTIEERRAHAAKLRGTFQNFGEYVRAVVEARNDRPDPRLSRAPTGAGETSPTAGGFLVPEAFADTILTTLYEDRTSILSYLQRFNIPDGSNTLRVPGVDETSRANAYRWGGVLADFVDEGAVEVAGISALQGDAIRGGKINRLCRSDERTHGRCRKP